MQTNDKIKRAGINTNVATVALDKGYGYEWFVTSISNNVPTERPVSATWRFYLQGDGETNSAPFTAELFHQLQVKQFNLPMAVLILFGQEKTDGDSILYTFYLDTIDGLQTPPRARLTLLLRILKSI